ncbi:MAG TPA: patatin-like phospholipase family protein, partial [Pirellulaceae bacterium]|nr:patatin-like phospholipase family protein [Pirellulaceae bacterium]
MYYDEAADDGVRNLSVGQAVAASAAVPGIFPPLELNGLYPDRGVRLVDGGVHDNQGTGALLDQDCTLLVVSDASGQSGAVTTPSDTPWGVGLRANELLQARIRAAQFEEVTTRRQANLLRGLLVVHLRKDLKSPPVDWEGCDNPSETQEQPGAAEQLNATEQPGAAERQGAAKRRVGGERRTTPYGILPEFQQRISEIRTDLDRFTEIEARALMASGYLMAVQEMQARFPQLSANRVTDAKWAFLSIQPVLAGESDESEARRVAAHLSAASRVLGRYVTDGATMLRSLPILACVVAALAVATWVLVKADTILPPSIVATAKSIWERVAPSGWKLFTLAAAASVTWLAAVAIPLTRRVAFSMALGAAYRAAYLGLSLPAVLSREVLARKYAARGRQA